METPIKIDDLGVPLFLETPIYKVIQNHTKTTPKSLWVPCDRCISEMFPMI